MRRVHPPGDRISLSSELPRDLAPLLRPALAALAAQIGRQIRAEVPEFRDPADDQIDLVGIVMLALNSFVDHIEDPDAPWDPLLEACRELGRQEAAKNREPIALQRALRIAFRLAVNHSISRCAEAGLPTKLVATLVEAEMKFEDRLAQLSVQSYCDAQPDVLADERHRLMELLRQSTVTSPQHILAKSYSAGWSVPDEVTAVALQPGTTWSRTIADSDVLADLIGPEPTVLIPGPLSEERLAMVGAAMSDGRAAAGLTVPIMQAAGSIRWARRTLDLVADGTIAGERLTLSSEHLLELWLMADHDLLELLAEQQLTALNALSDSQREAVLDTLFLSIVERYKADDAAVVLHIHPQTVHYRMRQARRLLGADALEDPDSRFGIELLLHDRRLRG